MKKLAVVVSAALMMLSAVETADAQWRHGGWGGAGWGRGWHGGGWGGRGFYGGWGRGYYGGGYYRHGGWGGGGALAAGLIGGLALGAITASAPA
jgi:hypothetical protein